MKAVEGGPTPGLRLFSYKLPAGCVVSPMAIRLDEPEFGGLQDQQGIFADAGKVVNGFIFNRGTKSDVGSPERISLANCTASRRSNLRRSAAFIQPSCRSCAT
jgi:hypothetical protein